MEQIIVALIFVGWVSAGILLDLYVWKKIIGNKNFKDPWWGALIKVIIWPILVVLIGAGFLGAFFRDVFLILKRRIRK